jgi:hypothetical protein
VTGFQGHLLFAWGLFALQFLGLEISIVADGIVDYADWDSVVDASVVNTESQGILGHLQVSCQNESFSCFMRLFAR